MTAAEVARDIADASLLGTRRSSTSTGRRTPAAASAS